MSHVQGESWHLRTGRGLRGHPAHPQPYNTSALVKLTPSGGYGLIFSRNKQPLPAFDYYTALTPQLALPHIGASLPVQGCLSPPGHPTPPRKPRQLTASDPGCVSDLREGHQGRPLLPIQVQTWAALSGGLHLLI